MSIFCMNCGRELPDDASFCLKCGKPLKGATTSTTQREAQWEYCEITCILAGFMDTKSYFVAKAVGSQGVYEAARSTMVFWAEKEGWRGEWKNTPCSSTNKRGQLARAALNEITTKLAADDWQPAGKDEGWWEYKYRRLKRS